MTIVYLDSSALLKRVLDEPQSDALADALASADARGDLLTSSTLAWVEIWRSLRRLATSELPHVVARATAGIAEYPISADTFLSARTIGTDLVRTLDALHLAAAVAVGAQELMTYDERMADAARGAGIAVVTPT